MPVKLGNNNLTFSGISEIYVGSNKVYSSTPQEDINWSLPLHITNSNNVAINFGYYHLYNRGGSGRSGSWTNSIEYSFNNSTWTSFSYNVGAKDSDGFHNLISIPAGQTLYLYGNSNYKNGHEGGNNTYHGGSGTASSYYYWNTDIFLGCSTFTNSVVWGGNYASMFVDRGTTLSKDLEYYVGKYTSANYIAPFMPSYKQNFTNLHINMDKVIYSTGPNKINYLYWGQSWWTKYGGKNTSNDYYSPTVYMNSGQTYYPCFGFYDSTGYWRKNAYANAIGGSIATPSVTTLPSGAGKTYIHTSQSNPTTLPSGVSWIEAVYDL